MRYLVLSLALIVVVEAVLLVGRERAVLLYVAAAVAALGLLGIRWVLTSAARQAVDESEGRDPAESLRRWLARTETLIERSATTRADWDKHLRPMLARQFELASGQRRATEPKAFRATALMVFGPELWPWVDPDNVSRNGSREPGPGREVLDAVLQRLERV